MLVVEVEGVILNRKQSVEEVMVAVPTFRILVAVILVAETLAKSNLPPSIPVEAEILVDDTFAIVPPVVASIRVDDTLVMFP